jgi:hypothetical protein
MVPRQCPEKVGRRQGTALGRAAELSHCVMTEGMRFGGNSEVNFGNAVPETHSATWGLCADWAKPWKTLIQWPNAGPSGCLTCGQQSGVQINEPHR